MICALTPEQTRILRRKVVKDLQKAIASDQPFTIEDYMKNMYKNVKEKTNNEELALAYASLVPTMINQIQANDPDTERKLYKGLRTKGISLDVIGDYIDKYADTTNGLKSLQEDLGLTVDLAKEAAEMQQGLDEEKKRENQGIIPPTADIPITELPPSDPNYDPSPTTEGEFYAKKHTVFATRDYEVKEWENKKSPDYNVKNPVLAFYFKMQRMFLSMLRQPNANQDSGKITIKNYPKEGVFLRLMPITKLNIDQIRPKDREPMRDRFRPNVPLPSMWESNEPVLVVTDVDGKVIPVNEDGEYDENGKPVYYYFRTIYPNQISEDGKTVIRLTEYDEKIAESRRNFSKKKLSLARAKEIIKEELQMALDLKNKLKENPDQLIRSRINGGSLGYFTEKYSERTPIKSFIPASQPIEVETITSRTEDPSTGRKSGRSYFKTEQTGNKYIEVERTPVNQIEGLTEKLVDLFVGDLMVKRSPTLTSPIRVSERIEFINNLVLTRSNGIQIFEEDDGSYKVKLRGQVIYQSKPTKKFNAQTQEYIDMTAEEMAREEGVAPDSATAANKIREYFNTLGIHENEATDLKYSQKQEAIQGTDPALVRDRFRVGSIFKNSATGKYYRVGYPKMNIPSGQEFRDVKITNGIAEVVPMTKSQYIKDNFSVKYELDGQGNLTAVNSYLTFDFVQEDINAAFPEATDSTQESTSEAVQKEVMDSPAVPQTGVADTDASTNLDSALNDPELQKNLDQKNVDVKATKEQIAAAKAWYEKHPMSKFIPFKVMFNMVNSRNKNTVANWTLNGITLFKGSDYSDLYHEAWHGFTQAFLTKEQKDSLYAEVERMSGSFTNYRGKRVTFNDPTYRALKQKKSLNTAEQNYVLNKEKEYEEYLAEDFRQWMLGGNKAKMEGAPVKRSIFQKILDFLKSLFSDATIDQIAGDTKSLRNIHSLYEKMRVGNLSEYTYSENNTTFGMLDKGAEALTNESGFKNLDFEESSKLVNYMDSAMSRFIDMFSEGKRKGQPDNQLSYKWTSTLLKKNAGLKYAYKQVLEDFRDIKTGLEAELLAATTDEAKITIQANLDRFNWAIANFGDTENLINNRPTEKGGWPKGLIGYHFMKSKILEPETKEAFFEEDVKSEEELLTKGREGYDRGGNETSMKEMASTDILLALRSIHKVDKKGQPVYVEGTKHTIVKNGKTVTVGIPELEDFDIIWNGLVKILQNTMSADVMYAKMLEYKKNHPEFPMTQIINKFGPTNTQGAVEFNLWTNLWQTFNKSHVPLLQTTVEIVTKDRKSFENWGFTIKPGVASSQSRKIGFSWQGIFATINTRFIKPDEGGINYLDISAVLSEYTHNRAVNQDPVQFLRDIGFFLEKDNVDIEKAIKEDSAVNVGNIYTALRQIQKRNRESPNYAITINKPLDIVRPYPPVEILDENGNPTGQVKAIEIKGEKRTYNDILDVEARLSNKHGNTGVTNTEGNTQFEHTLNNSLSVMVNAINDAQDVYKNGELIKTAYESLMEMPWMRHLDIKRNSFAKASIWMNSIFNLDETSPDFGKRRKDRYGKSVKLNLQNLSGVAISKDGVYDFDLGVASAKADTATKLIMDFHNTLLKGAPELMRHADKGTSFSVFLSNLYIPGRNFSRMYVNTVNFMKDITDGVTDGDVELFNGIILPHIGAELSRIQQMRKMKEEGFETFDVNYLNRGQGFVTFSFLSTKTKKALLKVKGDLSAYLNNGTQAALDLRKNIENDVYNYFNKQTEEATAILDKTKKQNGKDIIADNLAKNLIEDLKKVNPVVAKSMKPTDPKIKKALIKSFVVNSWVHNIESISMLYGDLAQYNMAKEEFHKRNAGIGSTGTLYRTDQSAINYVNEVLKRPYQSKYLPDAEQRVFDGTFNTAVLKDVEVKSAYIKDYAQALEDEEKDRLMSISKMSEEKATQEAKKKVYGYDKKTGKVGTLEKPIKGGLIHAYSEMNEGDGQGWISFDAYRIMLSLEGKWSDEQESLYNKIIKGEPVKASDVAQFFPTQKVQYFGPLKTDGLPITAFHKFSLVPLIPTMIKDKRAKELHDKMVNEGIDYALFQSGSKVGTITRAKRSEVDGKVSYKPDFDKLYTNDNREFSETPFVKNTIFLNFLKNQLEIAPKFKNKTIFSTQMRKLIEDGLVEGGVPTDFKTNLTLDERRKAWQELRTEEARLKESPKYKLYKAYENNVKKLTEIRMEELLDEMNWTMVNGQPQGSLENLLKFIKAEFRDRKDLAEHEIDFIDIGFGGKKVKHDFSMSLSAEKIEKMLNAIVTRRLVKQKINGEALIQVSGAGFENLSSLSADRDYKSPSAADLEKWGTNDLPTYRRSSPKDISKFELADRLSPIQQNFKDGTGGRKMRPEFAGKSSMDLIISGDRTRTTRARTDISRMMTDYNLSSIQDLVGKIIRMTDNTGRSVYTEITGVHEFTTDYQNRTWKKEGWEKEVTDRHIGDYPYAIEFKVVQKPTSGETQAMKVKIAMQGKFTKLLDLTDKEGNRVATRERLNALLKDEEWMNMGENRRMVTMVGARIPVQGLNSMEFMEIYEFLPEEAGNIIIPPAEIVAKSGADFDIDKLTVMMPTYRYEKQGDLTIKLTISKQVSEKEARELYNQAAKFLEKMDYLREQMPEEKDPLKQLTPKQRDDINKAFLQTENVASSLFEVFGQNASQMDEELIDMLVSGKKLDKFEDFYRKLNGGKAVENDLIWNMKEILALPDNFTNLIRPNGTELVKPLADELADKVSDYDPKAGVKDRMTAEEAEELGEDPTVIPGNRALEIGYNLYKHASNNIGKQVLGLLAVGNTYNTILNRIGAYMNPTAKVVVNKNDGSSIAVRQTLLTDHNTLDVNGEKAISLSHLYSVDGNRIADYISGLMNGAVDVAKDAWLFNVQGNKEIAPILEFLLSAGVAYETAVLMVSQPIIRDYVEAQRSYKGAFRDMTTVNPGSVMFFRNNARRKILNNGAYGFISQAGMASNLIRSSDKGHLYAKTLEVTEKAFAEDGGKVNVEKMRKAIQEYNTAKKEERTAEMDMEYQRAIFLHFLEIEEMAKAVRDVKMRMNFDTSKSDSLFDAQNKMLLLEELKENGRLPETLVDDILEKTVIGSFYVQPFQLKVWKDLFPLRNSPVLNDWIANKMREGIMEDNEATFNDTELFVNSMRSDLVSFIFQNSLKSFNIDTITNYKGDALELKKLSPSILEGEKVAVSALKIGIFYKDGKVYVDKRALREQYKNQDFQKAAYEEMGLAKLAPGVIESEEEYNHFVFEREYLRTMYPSVSSLENNTEFSWIKGQVKLDNPRYEAEIYPDYRKRINRLSYETFLKEKALENIYNTNKIFNSDLSYGDKFLFIKENFKDLFEKYSVLKKLGVSTVSENGQKSYTNIQMLDTANDPETLELYYENILNLSNPTVRKVDNAQDNKMISEFFANLPMVGFLQAGLSMKNKFNINRMMPQDRFLRFMEKPMKEYTDKLNPVVLDAFYQKFVEQNNKEFRGKTRVRFKNYYVPEFNLNTAVKQAKKGETLYNAGVFRAAKNLSETVLYKDEATGTMLYDPRYLKNEEFTKVIADRYPDSVFVFNDAFLARAYDGTTGLDTRFKGSSVSNKIGLPTYKYYTVGAQDKITDEELDSPDPAKNMRSKIDAAIELMKQERDRGKTLVFSRTGYGMEMNNFPLMLRAKDKEGNYPFSTAAPETFLYLSEQLYKNFGYVNPGYQKLEQGIEVLREYQDITDEEVLELMSKCYT